MVSPTLFSSATDEWATPQEFFDELNKEFGFRLDVCATRQNVKCPFGYYFDEGMDGLTQEWARDSAHIFSMIHSPRSGFVSVWMNPPYGREIGKWVGKAYEESLKGATVVCLLPVRTDTKWWHSYVEGKAEVRFIKGRLKFGGAKNSAPFPSCIVIFRGR